jgi:large subunit ribosomal protein L35
MAKKQKLKTHKGASKRFKKTGTGKVKRFSAFKRHILTGKTTKNKRHLRKAKIVTPGDARKIDLMLPYE